VKSQPHTARSCRALLLAVAGILLAETGCSVFHSDPQSAKRAGRSDGDGPTTGPRQVRLGGDAMVLGEADEPALRPQQLVDEVARLVDKERPASAARFVERYPDVAWELLRSTPAREARSETLQFIAAAHDRQCTRGGPSAGWAALLADRAANPRGYGGYDARRRQFLDHLHGGRVKEALAQDVASVPKGSPGKLLAIDGLHLSGLALLVDERPAEAAAALDRAARLARDAHPYQAVRLTLLLSEARRRSGDHQAALECWKSATQGATELALADTPVADPILWERISYLRPVDADWPRVVQRSLGRAAASLGMPADDRGQVLPASTAAAERAGRACGEMLVWTCIGQWRLGRGQPQSALVALKRAEAGAGDPREVARLRLAQAQALLALDQPSAARAMLVQMAGDSQPGVSRPATAMLGTLMLQEGSTVQGYNLLRRAVEEDTGFDWPERPQAEADLGLAYLLLGDEEAGLRWLHAAQQKLQAAGDHDQLARSLENELRYFEQQKRKREAREIRERLESLQRPPGSSAGTWSQSSYSA